MYSGYIKIDDIVRYCEEMSKEYELTKVKHGHWELDGTCSVCKKHTLQSYGNFCCYCGADMRGETE